MGALWLAYQEVVQRRSDLPADTSRLGRVTVSRATTWDVTRPVQVQVEQDLRTLEDRRVASLGTEVAALRDEMKAEAHAARQRSGKRPALLRPYGPELGQDVDQVRGLLHQVTERTWRSLYLSVGGLAL